MKSVWIVTTLAIAAYVSVILALEATKEAGWRVLGWLMAGIALGLGFAIAYQELFP